LGFYPKRPENHLQKCLSALKESRHSKVGTEIEKNHQKLLEAKNRRRRHRFEQERHAGLVSFAVFDYLLFGSFQRYRVPLAGDVFLMRRTSIFHQGERWPARQNQGSGSGRNAGALPAAVFIQEVER
jgi:hypothetical protein